MNRPRIDMKEYEECEAAVSNQRFRYAKWLMLWHLDSEDEYGDMLRETRLTGYDGCIE